MELSDNNELMEVVRQSALNIKSVSEQMGVIVTAVNDLKVRSAKLEDRVSNNEMAFDRFVEKQRMNERVEADERQEYADSIKGRVYRLLNEVNRLDLYGKFAAKCWNDCKSHSRMRGKTGFDTKKVDHNDVINFIGTWEPYSYGTMGYIEYLDSKKGGAGT